MNSSITLYIKKKCHVSLTIQGHLVLGQEVAHHSVEALVGVRGHDLGDGPTQFGVFGDHSRVPGLTEHGGLVIDIGEFDHHLKLGGNVGTVAGSERPIINPLVPNGNYSYHTNKIAFLIKEGIMEKKFL